MTDGEEPQQRLPGPAQGPTDESRELIRALADPGIYPLRPERVDVRETHISAVFLAGDEAYKLKKPVDFGFLDYSTLVRRRIMCHREVELNRRLAPDVYLGVEKVVRTPDGYRLGGRGTVVDYVVRMRRLPDERMLSALLDAGQVGEDEVRAVGRHVAAFHARAARGPRVDRFGRPAAIRRNDEENFQQTAPFVGRVIRREAYDEIVTTTRAFMTSNRATLLDRVAAGRIRDGHGDLRAEHVYLLDGGIQIIDCIEFSQRLRYGDVAADLGFLAMDLDAHGRPDLAGVLVSAYEQAAGDDLSPVLDFYRCYRAYVRGKVTCFRANEPGLPPPEADRAFMEARRYFHLALRYARHDRQPRLVLVSGLTGAGKSTLADALGDVLAAGVIAADPTRKRLAGVERGEGRGEPIDAGLYSPAMNARVYQALLDGAAERLASGRSVILDATYRRRSDREAACDLALRLGARFLAVECVAEPETVRRRVEQRAREGNSWSDGRWEVYLHQRQEFEPLDELPANQRVRVDTAMALSGQVDAVLERIERSPGHPLPAIA